MGQRQSKRARKLGKRAKDAIDAKDSDGEQPNVEKDATVVEEETAPRIDDENDAKTAQTCDGSNQTCAILQRMLGGEFSEANLVHIELS